MAQYLDVHPANPQERLIGRAADALRDGGLVAYPTDSGYALGCTIGNAAGRDRIAAIRRLDDKHHYTLMCADFAQMGQLVHVSNHVFRALKAATPGPYTFILPGTAEVPRRLLQAKKHTVGVRISPHPVVQALLGELGEAMLTSTLILPGAQGPMTEAWAVKEELDHAVDVVIESECGLDPTTVIDLSGEDPVLVRAGAGDPSRFV